MPDPNPTPPAPTPTPEPPKKSAGQRGEINANWLDEISGTEKLAVVARQERKLEGNPKYDGKMVMDLL
jgi:hypothetical protein